MTAKVYLNGEYLPLEEAKISVLDRGFLFGDGIYEVIPVYGQKLFRAEHHLQRLHDSLKGIQISIDITTAQWMAIFRTLIKAHPQQEIAIYLQVTRGTMQKRLHTWNQTLTPNILVMCTPAEYPSQDLETRGVKAITLDDIRWEYCQLKTTNLLANVMLRQKAIDKQAVEAILIRDGYAIEGAASNLFIVQDDILITPPKGNHLLGGITRDLVLEICRENKVLYRETFISEDELHSADEVWITSSTKEIVPVTTLNQHKVGKGVPGPLWLKMIQLYQDYKNSVMLN